MHDPSFLALTIRLPIPRRTRWRDSRPGQPRWPTRKRYTGGDVAGKPMHRWWRPAAWDMRLAGRAFEMMRFVDVWHDEPGGRDSGEVCHYPKGWRLLGHLRHCHANVLPWGRFLRWAFTRCEWCRGPSRKGTAVHCSLTWSDDGRRTRRFWRGERGLYHGDCSGAYLSHRTCLCPQPTFEHGGDHGRCAECCRSRGWGTSDTALAAHRLVVELVPMGRRPTPEVAERIRTAWALARAASERAGTVS